MNLNQKIEDIKSKYTSNYNEREMVTILENKIKQTITNHFTDDDSNLHLHSLIINFIYNQNIVKIKIDKDQKIFLDLYEKVGSYFFLAKDLIFFKVYFSSYSFKLN